MQLGVTLCSLALGWLGEPLAASVLHGLVQLCRCLPHARIYAHVVAVALGFAVYHLLPRGGGRTGAQVAGAAPRRGAGGRRGSAHAGLHGAGAACGAAAQGSAAVILRGFDIPMTERAAVHSPEELKLIATAARRMGLLPPFQETLIHRALELDDVSDPRDHDAAAEDFLAALEHAA